MNENIRVWDYIKKHIKKDDKVTKLLLDNYNLFNISIRKIFNIYGVMSPEEMITLINNEEEGVNLAQIGFERTFKGISNTAFKSYNKDMDEVIGLGLENAMYQNSLPSSSHKIGK